MKLCCTVKLLRKVKQIQPVKTFQSVFFPVTVSFQPERRRPTLQKDSDRFSVFCQCWTYCCTQCNPFDPFFVSFYLEIVLTIPLILINLSFLFFRKEVLEIPHKTGFDHVFLLFDKYLSWVLKISMILSICAFLKGSRQDSVRYATGLERILPSVPKPAWKRWDMYIDLHCIMQCCLLCHLIIVYTSKSLQATWFKEDLLSKCHLCG